MYDLHQNNNQHNLDPTSHQHQQHDDFLEQMLSSIPSSWPPDLSTTTISAASAVSPLLQNSPLASFEDQSTLLASKFRQHQIGGAAKALMLQQQLMLSRGLAAGNGLRSPTGHAAGNGGGLLPPMPLSLNGDHTDVVDDASPFKSANQANDAAVQALYNGFTGSLGQPHSNQSQQHFHHSQNFGAPAGPSMNQAATASGGSTGNAGGAAPAQPRQQRVRARRGQATDPHSIAERLRRERIAERMKALQELVPNANKTDKASMLDEIIDYVKFLQLQVKVLSMSRLGGAAAVAPLVADMSSEGGGDCVQGNGRNSNGGGTTQTASSSNNNNDSMTVTEHQVAKLMEEDMGSAMQYLQGKGLCLMPISLATAISTATCHSRNTMTLNNHGLINGNGNTTNPATLLQGSANAGVGGGPSSPSISGLTVQSATLGNAATAAGADHPPGKDATSSVSKP